ncbi:MAG: UvrD-helicase domain-containing protein [Deltaproteobacteria bacterium]|nr:UvrD-helicase domain-containing protein [Deltaproteobacteria bacterium]
MKFIADFHVHSKFSRATAKNLDFENLYIAAQLKGINVVGTGDFTHPGWFSEIKEKLVPAEPGLFKLKDTIAKECDKKVHRSCRGNVRFILVSEISNIYKKNDKTRKNHNLIFLPDLEKAAHFNAKLDSIGNINSDGRPILGLDAKNLLEITLETTDQGFLIPAHIWTPWFSLLGSKSGFNSVKECFEDLTPYIFAVETGLSSDPAMNWRISDLDGYTLISNSDAHSPMKLGREANLFDTKLNYQSIKKAMETGHPDRFLGTIEFYPEEGKYHLDGHRNCGKRLHPKESVLCNNICSVCGKKVTLGVLYRVEELADRKEGEKPEKTHPYKSIVPLADIISEIVKTGPSSKKVSTYYHKALEKLGPEFDILNNVTIDEINHSGMPLLGEAIRRVRNKEMDIFPGFDGEFGKIKLFKENEQEELLGQKSLFMTERHPEKKTSVKNQPVNKKTFKKAKPEKKTSDRKRIETTHLNALQKKAVEHNSTPLLIIAGPGTGKTLTITHKIAYIINNKNVSPQNIIAVTFTKKAALEMKERLRRLLKGQKELPQKELPMVATFHSLCFSILKNLKNKAKYSIIDELDRKYMVSEAIKIIEDKRGPVSIPSKSFLEMIVSSKQKILEPSDNLEVIASKHNCPHDLLKAIYGAYQGLLSMQGLYDYEDLIFKVVKLLETGKNIRKKYQEFYKYIFIDEYQDLNHGQYRIVKALASEDQNLFVIGDPDQSIYGFRGSEVEYFKKFIEDYSNAEVIHLKKNYRSTETILEASYQIINDQHVNFSGSRIYSEIEGDKQISIFEVDSERSEAVVIGKKIEEMIGGTGFHYYDFGKAEKADSKQENLSFSDFAVLTRTHSQSRVFADVFKKAGIPFQAVSREDMLYRKGLPELLSFLKIIEHVGSYADFERIILFSGIGIGKKTFALLKKWCFQNHLALNESLLKIRRFPVKGMSRIQQLKLDEFLKTLSSLEDRCRNKPSGEKLQVIRSSISKINTAIQKDEQTEEAFRNFVAISDKHRKTTEFLEENSLWSDTDMYNHNAEKVSLMTMHASKGLEFTVVFIAGCEKGFVPYEREDSKKTDFEEERRLFFVAMTRAKKNLFLTHAKNRRVFGKRLKRETSPFIKDIDAILKTDETLLQKKYSKTKQIQLELF